MPAMLFDYSGCRFILSVDNFGLKTKFYVQNNIKFNDVLSVNFCEEIDGNCIKIYWEKLQ